MDLLPGFQGIRWSGAAVLDGKLKWAGKRVLLQDWSKRRGAWFGKASSIERSFPIEN
jgi:hypothetical protein